MDYQNLLGRSYLWPTDLGPINVCIGAVDPRNKTLSLYVMDSEGYKMSRKISWIDFARALRELDIMSN